MALLQRCIFRGHTCLTTFSRLSRHDTDSSQRSRAQVQLRPRRSSLPRRSGRDLKDFLDMDTPRPSTRRRAAAQKASKLAIEQMDSSQEASEGEAVVDVSAIRKAKGTKAKRLLEVMHNSRPPSGIQQSRLTRTRSRSFDVGSASSSKSLPTSAREKQPVEAIPVVKPNGVALLPESDSDIEFIGFGPAPTSTPSHGSQPTCDLDGIPVSSSISSVKTPVPKKRVFSNPGRSPFGSPGSLTPLTSPEAPRAHNVPDESPSPGPAVESWSLADLGRIVWVRLDFSGHVSESRSNSIWWPAHITGNVPLQVSPFGQSPGFEKRDSEVEIVIECPSQRNIRPVSVKTGSDVLRFNEHNYGGPSTDSRAPLFSPRKRQKTADHDILSRWKEARKLMVRQDAEENDGLPRFFAYDSDSDDIATDLRHEVAEEEVWAPPPPKLEYDIPGELVLSKDKANTTQYWPAKILEYVPPKHRKQKVRYKVLFFDRTVKDVTEDMFYTESQAGFRTCKLGESEGNYGLDDEEQDADENMTFPFADEDEETLRAATPIPDIPPPMHFEALSIEEQFNYVKPVLVAILKNKYEPAWPRHEAFMRSAASRQKVVNSSHSSGKLNGYELDQLGPLLRQWLRRRQMRQERGIIPGDESTDTVLAIPGRPDNVPLPPSTVGSEPDFMLTVDVTSDDDAVTDPQSEGSLPPSSFVSAPEVERVMSFQRDMPPPSDTEGGITAAVSGAADEVAIVGQYAHGSVSDSDKSLQVLSGHWIPTKYFAALSELEQLTYCSSILLQEAKYQLLLWRHGLRHSFELLSSTEEEKLHKQAEAKADEMNWVHTIILSRRAMEKRMLPTFRNTVKPLTKLRSGRG